jgi:hypothetical protein
LLALVRSLGAATWLLGPLSGRPAATARLGRFAGTLSARPPASAGLGRFGATLRAPSSARALLTLGTLPLRGRSRTGCRALRTAWRTAWRTTWTGALLTLLRALPAATATRTLFALFGP